MKNIFRLCVWCEKIDTSVNENSELSTLLFSFLGLIMPSGKNLLWAAITLQHFDISPKNVCVCLLYVCGQKFERNIARKTKLMMIALKRVFQCNTEAHYFIYTKAIQGLV
jgi:hypothetical protein